MFEAERDIGFEKAELVAAIVAPASGAEAVEVLPLGDQRSMALRCQPPSVA
jgi:hypothetical protein